MRSLLGFANIEHAHSLNPDFKAIHCKLDPGVARTDAFEDPSYYQPLKDILINYE